MDEEFPTFRKYSVALSLLFCLCGPAFAYTVKLKDGSLIFARNKYTAKGTKAIITLQNGTVTQIALDSIDIPGTEKYNQENPGNVIAIDDPASREGAPPPAPPPTASLQDAIRRKRTRMDLPPSNPVTSLPEQGASGGSWLPVEQSLEGAFTRVFDGAGIAQYRLQNFRGAVKLLATTNTEEAVFNTLSAAARALADYANRGKDTAIEIALTTSSGENAGTFQMTTEQARQLVNRTLRIQDYFLRKVGL